MLNRICSATFVAAFLLLGAAAPALARETQAPLKKSEIKKIFIKEYRQLLPEKAVKSMRTGLVGSLEVNKGTVQVRARKLGQDRIAKVKVTGAPGYSKDGHSMVNNYLSSYFKVEGQTLTFIKARRVQPSSDYHY